LKELEHHNRSSDREYIRESKNGKRHKKQVDKE
ncbi:unnamed protein product, partial [marine sediment metagenome]